MNQDQDRSFLSKAFIKLEREAIRRKNNQLPYLTAEEAYEILFYLITTTEDYDYFQSLVLKSIISRAINDSIQELGQSTQTDAILYDLKRHKKIVIGIPPDMNAE